MNASYLSDLFKQTTGMTFTEFVIEHRLQQAKALLLRDPQAKLYEIAVGYKNPKHFSQLFKKHVGVLPGEFRELRRAAARGFRRGILVSLQPVPVNRPNSPSHGVPFFVL